MGTIYHVCGVWPPPFCVDCLIFCVSIPVSHSLESQHFVFELFLLLQAKGGFYCISVKHQWFFNMFGRRSGFSIPVCCTTSLPLLEYKEETNSGFSGFFPFLSYFYFFYCITEMIWDIEDLPLRLHQCIISISLLFFWTGFTTCFVFVRHWQSGMIRVRGHINWIYHRCAFFSSAGKIKAVCHFDRLQGWFIRTCNSNSFVVHLYVATHMNYATSLTVFSLISSPDCSVQLEAAVASTNCRNCTAELFSHRQNQ